ncbi:ABC-type protease/lipase transport system fused ATPase/permease subunit [Pseudochelatococcus lubricantis]|uniref:ABC-type protease/lipase transport system fused ATPase/permease subunit n=1 Tax=Pseudochelatococcus lubricantis TaxID=1538102 RepID=A0ABX0V4Y9_9HYPH|nr:ABC transporter transmembrane domain-containing protein [Pseudochelatococcus lubricantis]NIJ60287.1 ABC-type protease/lipase transport system fused ATPase/permease subunit [Pseudochelatococcus lubricantis]
MSGRPSDVHKASTPLDQTISAARPAILGLIGFGSVTSILSLVPPLYMLNVFDRVMTSRNITTLIMLTAIALFLVLIGAIVERMRATVSLRVGAWGDEKVSPALLAAVQDVALRSGRRVDVQALRDLDSFREFWTGTGLQTLVRAAWSPLFVIVLFFLNPLFGYIAILGLLVVLALTIANNHATHKPLGKAAAASRKATAWMSATIRNIEVMHAMGMRPAFRKLWQKDHKEALFWQNDSSDKSAAYVVASSFFQSALGLCVLALGIYLAIQGEISAGAAFVSRILFGQAVGPLTGLIGQLKGYTTSRISYDNLQHIFRSAVDDSERIVLDLPPGSSLAVM